jgi:predicted PurR-regulated permease PerM
LTSAAAALKPRIEKLARGHVADASDRGADPLNTCLKRFAFGNQSAGAAQTYVAVAEDRVVGYKVRPIVLSREDTYRINGLNPVFVIVSLFFWHTIWGIPGALLAVPLLAVLKIVCDRIERLKPVGHVLGS